MAKPNIIKPPEKGSKGTVKTIKTTCNPICGILLNAGVPSDLKWLCLMNFLRTLEKDDLYNAEQKRLFHGLLQDIIKKADFSDPHYEIIEMEVERIRHLNCKEREDYLNQKLKEAEDNFQGLKSLLENVLRNYANAASLGSKLTHEKVEDIEKLKDITVTALEQEEDRGKIIAGVVSATSTIVERMNREILDWKRKAEETERWKQKAIEMERLATIDALTSLYNRRAFDLHIEGMVNAMLGRETYLSLMIIDIDHFKNFNDTYGHDVGDEVLKLVASIIKKNATREGDFAARYGGEEMIIVCEGMDIEQATSLAEKIRKDIEKYRFLVKGDVPKETTVTVSIGISELDCCKSKAMYSGKDASFIIQQFIQSADKALYDAKKAGRNRVCLYNKGSV